MWKYMKRLRRWRHYSYERQKFNPAAHACGGAEPALSEVEWVFRPAFEQVSIQGVLGPEPGFRGRRKGPELPRSPALRYFYRCARVDWVDGVD